jgi:pantoate--beta-alanine ligase
MRIYHTKRFLQRYLNQIKKGEKVGFVPTMGALHEGHLSLVRNAKKSCSIVVVSIFVNPTQFDRKEDLDNYPQTLDEDLAKLKNENCDVVFIPSVYEMYSKNIVSHDFDFEGLDKVMEGAHRKGHFAGVGTVVKRLFEIVVPDEAFFGEKDFQQLQIIKKMIEIEKMKIKIVGNPIHREKDGLAMSSRNMRLTKEQRKAAPFIYKTLQEAKDFFINHNVKETEQFVIERFKSHPILALEYFTIAGEKTLLNVTNKKPNEKYRGFIAVFVGKIRLIDNMVMG